MRLHSIVCTHTITVIGGGSKVAAYDELCKKTLCRLIITATDQYF